MKIPALKFDDVCGHRRCIMEHLEKDRVDELPGIMREIFNKKTKCGAVEKPI